MKTFRNSGIRFIFRSFIVIILAGLAVVAISSCGKSKSSDSAAKDDQSKVSTVAPADTAYVYVDEMPVFPGGDQEILNYIAKNTSYPKEASQKAIEGKVVIKFIVHKDCTIGNIEVLKSVDPMLDAEAIRVVSTLPKFEKPGIFHGEKVATYYMVPISFKLN